MWSTGPKTLPMFFIPGFLSEAISTSNARFQASFYLTPDL